MKQILFILLAFFSFSCEKEEAKNEVAKEKDNNSKIEFYELLNFNEVYIDSTGDINMSRAILKEKPIIENSDIISYNSIKHTMILTKQAKEKVTNFFLSDSTSDKLLLKVNGEGIYGTRHHSNFDSSWPPSGSVYFDILEGDTCALSYEPNVQYPKNKDKRDNEKLMKALEASGRLK